MTAPLSDPSESGKTWLRQWAATVFTLDVRSLAALRIGLGLVLLINACDLIRDVPAFYTDAGILPRASLRQFNVEEHFTSPPPWVSLHMLSGEAWFQYALLGASALCALAVLVGYWTQTALFGSCVLLVGLQARNPMPLCGGDDVLRCLLWWSLFLPLGATWSLDRRRETSSPTHACSVATVALMLQLACIYFCSGLLKWHPKCGAASSAPVLRFALDHLTTRFGHELLQYPRLLQGLTCAMLVLEIIGPLALFSPWLNARLRTIAVAAFCALHLGIAATMNIGLFPWTCMVYWLALLPSEFWDGLASSRAVRCWAASDSLRGRFSRASIRGKAS